MQVKSIARFVALTMAAGFLFAPVANATVSHHHKGSKCCRKGHGKDLIGQAKAQGNLKTFIAAVDKAGLACKLSCDGPYTVFAPTDTAFGKLPKKQLDDLLADPKALKSVLLYHVVAKSLPASSLSHLGAQVSMEGDKLMTNAKDSTVWVNGSQVTKADINCSNGIIHEIDDVLTPGAGGHK
jgi:uncharacterized surface protein with fasciclin (FAS1) repeats